MVPFTNPLLPMSPNGAPMFYNGATFTPMPPTLTSLNSPDGCLVPPPGYSFVTVDVPSATPERSASVEPPTAGETDVLLPPVEQNVSRSRSSSVVSEDPQNSRAEGETTPTTKQQNKKFRHRSKQVRIMEVHQKLKEVPPSF